MIDRDYLDSLNKAQLHLVLINTIEEIERLNTGQPGETSAYWNAVERKAYIRQRIRRLEYRERKRLG